MSSRAEAANPSSSADPEKLLQDWIDRGCLELPLLPEACSKLLKMCNDPDCPPASLAATIRGDQSIASHLLRTANSAMYSTGAPIVSLQQAAARLGIQRIREIVLIISCRGRVFAVDGFEEEVRSSFHHSLGAAAFAQEIARSLRLNVEDAFLTGLLHDIGRPVLLQAITDLQKVHQLTLDREEVLIAVEQLRVAIGSHLIEIWHLPGRIARVVGSQKHDRPAAEELRREVKMLRLSIDFAHCLMRPDESAEHYQDHALVAELNIYPDQLDAILDKRHSIIDWIGSTQ